MSTSLQQILVHLDSSPGGRARLEVAREIARHQGSAVCALYAVTPSYLDIPYGGAMAPSVASDLVQIDRERRDKVRADFDQAMQTPGPVADWAEAVELPVIESFIEQALTADMLVLGQHDPGAQPELPGDFNESVIIASGKPALVVPYTGWTRKIGETVVIAWKPTRESARAVTAALPLLQRAQRVHVLSFGEEVPPEIRGHRLGLAGWLRQHAVEAQFHHEPVAPEALGEMVLSRLFDLGADMLVMGCYGHSRARELVLGGVSRTVMRAQTVPVLMAH
ncbi:MAG TPA: universal stress protein [Ramlibacter sp.]|uniref:universal stress protein n=1 Tax=Ramlibacter sp. TaxID=1917967 RepID=UPI002C5DA26F|nr:universal stress protein [Ramlibacter sp.]HVZ42837.1 universal stress protein [Ramlibacter sp.]